MDSIKRDIKDEHSAHAHAEVREDRKRVARVGIVEDGSAPGGGGAGGGKSCFRVLAPNRVLGEARGRGAFEKTGAVRGSDLQKASIEC